MKKIGYIVLLAFKRVIVVHILQYKVSVISLNVVARAFRRFADDVTTVVPVLVHGVHARREFITRLECPSSERLFLRLGARDQGAQRVEELFSHRARRIVTSH